MKAVTIDRTEPGAPAPAEIYLGHQEQSMAAARPHNSSDRSIDTETAVCAVCAAVDSEPVGFGVDFKYRTGADSCLATHCRDCGLIDLGPRQAREAQPINYQDSYDVFHFRQAEIGTIYRIRAWLEMRPLRDLHAQLDAQTRILAISRGDGFDLALIRRIRKPGWRIEGVEFDRRAIDRAPRSGFTAHEGAAETLPLDDAASDPVLLMQTIERQGNPLEVLRAVCRALKARGRTLRVFSLKCVLALAAFAQFDISQRRLVHSALLRAVGQRKGAARMSVNIHTYSGLTKSIAA